MLHSFLWSYWSTERGTLPDAFWADYYRLLIDKMQDAKNPAYRAAIAEKMPELLSAIKTWGLTNDQEITAILDKVMKKWSKDAISSGILLEASTKKLPGIRVKQYAPLLPFGALRPK